MKKLQYVLIWRVSLILFVKTTQWLATLLWRTATSSGNFIIEFVIKMFANINFYPVTFLPSSFAALEALTRNAAVSGCCNFSLVVSTQWWKLVAIRFTGFLDVFILLWRPCLSPLWINLNFAARSKMNYLCSIRTRWHNVERQTLGFY